MIAIRVLAMSLLLVLLAICSIAFQYRYGVRDTIAFLIGFEPGGTVYAGGFSEPQFSRVRVGMTETDVIGILGKPLYRLQSSAAGHHMWQYTWQRTGQSNFHYRTVVFAPSGTVMFKGHEYWID